MAQAIVGGSRDPASVVPNPPALPARPKLGDEVARYLRDAVMSGVYARGARIRVEELAARLEVSTMPAREALGTLVVEGLLEALPRRGYRVLDIRREDIEDVFGVHAFVAGLLAERAAQAIDPRMLTQLRALQAEIERTATRRLRGRDRAEKVEQLNYEFHRTINRVPNAARLRWFLRAASRYVPRLAYTSVPGWVNSSVHDHPAIIEALARHDSPAARSLTEEHVRRAGDQIVEQLADSGYWSDR